MTKGKIIDEERLSAAILNVMENRSKIVEEFCIAFLAANVPNENLNESWLINNVELVQIIRNDEIVFYFRLKEEK